MPVDEFHLRNQARDLADLYRQLHGLKHTKPTPPEAHTSHQSPGPKTPGNWLIISTYIDLEQRLREVAFNAFADTHIKLRDGDAAAPRLCHLLAFHAYTVSRLDWAEDLLDELEDQARIIRRRVDPPRTAKALALRAQSQNQLFTAAHAAAAASAITGHKIDRKQITYWGKTGHITTHRDKHGKACYKLSEIVNHLLSKDCQLST